MFKIGEFSQLSKISTKMLRHYDEIDLLKPTIIDEFTGYRYYSADKIDTINRIVALKELGFSLLEIKTLLSKDLSNEELISYLKSKKAEQLSTIEEINNKITKIDSYLEILKLEDEPLNYNVILKGIPDTYVASIRRQIPNIYNQFELFTDLFNHMKDKKYKFSEPINFFTIYHNGDCDDLNVDIEVCQKVDFLYEDDEQVTFKKIEKVPLAAHIIHKGPTELIHKAYTFAIKWLEYNNYSICGEIRDVFHNNPFNEGNSDNYITEIIIPIKV